MKPGSDDDVSSMEGDGSESEDDPIDESQLDFGRDELIEAMCFDKATECQVKLVLDALRGPGGGKELDIPLLIKRVESILNLHRLTNENFLDAAVAQTTSILGTERFEDEIQSLANELMGRLCPEMAIPEEAKVRPASIAAGNTPAAGIDQVIRGADKMPTDSRQRRARKRSHDSLPSTPSPPSKRRHRREMMPPKSPASSEQSEQRTAAAATESDRLASMPRSDNSTTALRGQSQGRPADEDSSLDAATLGPAAAHASLVAASTVDVREETCLISAASFEGKVLVFGTSFFYRAERKLLSIFDSSNPKLDELPSLIRTVFDCVSGVFNSTVCLKESLAAEQRELEENAVAMDGGTQFTAVLKCMEKSSKRSDEGNYQECERLQRLRKVIYSLRNGGKKGKAETGVVREFLANRVSARHRITAYANLGVMHLILSSNSVSQILSGLKYEDECIGSLGLLARNLNPGVPFDANVSGWDALTDTLMPSFGGRDEVVTLTFDVEDEDGREISRHRLAAKVVCMLIDSLNFYKGRNEVMERRKQYLYGENGVWPKADSAKIHQSGGAASTSEQGGGSGDGYFVQTETDDDGQVKPETDTHRDRRMRPIVLLKLLLLRAAISAREPDWDFVGVDFMCNLLSLSPTDQLGCFRHITKKYFCGGELKDKVRETAKNKRASVDKKIAKASSKYAKNVMQNVVIENEQQLNSLKRLYS